RRALPATGGRAERGEHLVRNVYGRAVVDDALLREQHVELLRARVLLSLLDHLAAQRPELLVAAQIQVLEELVLRALQLALSVANLALEVQTFLLAHDRRVALERFLLASQA